HRPRSGCVSTRYATYQPRTTSVTLRPAHRYWCSTGRRVELVSQLPRLRHPPAHHGYRATRIPRGAQMSISDRSWYLVPRGKSRISRDKFVRLAWERFAHSVLAERDPGEYYDAIENTTETYNGIEYQVDALFVLQKF